MSCQEEIVPRGTIWVVTRFLVWESLTSARSWDIMENMLVDIIFVLLLIVFALHGAWRGFLKGLLAFFSVLISIVFSVLLARPIAGLLNGWFGWGDSLGELVNENLGINLAEDTGFLVLIAIVSVAFFIFLRIAVFFIARMITRLKRFSRRINRVDQLLGLFLGIFRFLLYFFALTALIVVASTLTATTGIEEFLFGDSNVAGWFFGFMSDWVVPIIRGLGAAIGIG